MTRRFFLRLANATLLAAAALPTALFWWRSSRGAAPSDQWVDLGAAIKIPEGEWLPRRFSFERTNRWRQELTEELVYVRRVDRDITILSPVCPHARCVVSRDGDGFACPCHRSSFDSQGISLTGPSPRRLDELGWKVSKGRLLVNYQQFRPGVPESDVIAG